MPIYEYSCQQCGNNTEFLTGGGGKNPDMRRPIPSGSTGEACRKGQK